MSVEALLERVRDLYVDTLVDVIANERRSGVRVIVEPCLRDAQGELAREGDNGLPLRVDALVMVESRPLRTLRVDSRRQLSFSPTTFSSGSVDVAIAPFRWDACSVELEGYAGDDPAPVVEWFERLFDVEDLASPDDRGLHGVAHFMSDPLATPRGITYELDLGSAPVRAVEDLLALAARVHVATFRLGLPPDHPRNEASS